MSRSDQHHPSLGGLRATERQSTVARHRSKEQAEVRLTTMLQPQEAGAARRAKARSQRQRHREEDSTGINCCCHPSRPPLCLLEFGWCCSSRFLEKRHARLQVMPQLSRGPRKSFRCSSEPTEPVPGEERSRCRPSLFASQGHKGPGDSAERLQADSSQAFIVSQGTR